MYKKGPGFLLVLLLLTILVSGCQTEQRKPLETKPQEQTGLSDSDRRILADRLSRLATDVNGVQKATVVITDITLANDSKNIGTTAKSASETDISGMIVMLGISVNDQVNEEKVKNDVRDKLKASDKRISQVLVTSDPELLKKINDVAAGIIKGEPISEMDLKQLGGKLKEDKPAY